MPFTHYPKLAWNLLFAWRWPAPPDKPGFLNQPRFASVNLAKGPLAPGETVRAFHEAQNFTRFTSTFFADQPLEIKFDFSNDDVDEKGDFVTDENVQQLNYDGKALKHKYEPDKQDATGKALVTIYGRWLRVEITNVGKVPCESMRVYVRGSVF